MKTWLLVLAVMVVAWPRLADACPACAGSQGSGIASGVLIASMMFFPVAAAVFGYRFIKRINSYEDSEK